MLLTVLVVLGGLQGPAVGQDDLTSDTGLELPEITVRVDSLSGQANVKYETGTQWVSARVGQELSKGDRFRTDDGSTATLKIPAVALMSVSESTNLKITKLNRLREEQGMLIRQEKVTVNEINLDVDQGEVENSVKDYEKVNTDYELKTPNAVAGVRGTTFECDVSTDQTECTVLDGNVTFASRFGTQNEIELGALQRSRLGANDTQPSEPESVDEEEVQDLQKVKDKAEKGLALKPVLNEVQVNGNELSRSGQGVYKTTLNADKIDEITLSGQARAQESGATLESVAVRQEGDELSVEGLENWSVSVPVASFDGQQRVLTFVVQITDDQGNQSRAYPVQITLQSQQEPTGVIPEDLRDGNFAASLEQVGQKRGAEISFPLELTGQDFLRSTGVGDTGVSARSALMLRGTFDSDSPIVGVAYRLAGDQDWTEVASGRQWSVSLPMKLFDRRSEFSVEVIGWTEDGYRSE
ncbi:MAG: FecR domain-containing protein [bacterium]